MGQGYLGDDIYATRKWSFLGTSRRAIQGILTLIDHAKDCGVEMWIAPRLSSVDLCSIIRGAVAVVSMAHSEPFGLTPIEAQTVGTPALFVDEGGFRETISDEIRKASSRVTTRHGTML